MLGLIKKLFIGLLTGLVDGSWKCLSLSNQKCKIQPTLINLHPNEYSQELSIIHLQLNWIDVLEVVILFIIYPIKYVFQTKQKI